jgi:enoyl-CoA hydratase
MDDMQGRITAARDGDIFRIGIDRPKKLNGFSPKMLEELSAAYDAFERDEAARCALVFAEGPHFTAGIQLDVVGPSFLKEGRSIAAAGRVDPFDLRPPLRSKPVVVAVQGYCFTIGIELMLAADVVIAAEGTRFRQLEVQRGLIASAGATLRMVERAGWGNAMRYLLTGDEFDAATALRLGFVQEVVPDGEQMARAEEIARRIAGAAPLAVRAMRSNARKAVHEGPEAAIAELGDIQRRLMASEDVQEGVKSFLERRPGRFTGR